MQNGIGFQCVCIRCNWSLRLSFYRNATREIWKGWTSRLWISGMPFTTTSTTHPLFQPVITEPLRSSLVSHPCLSSSVNRGFCLCIVYRSCIHLCFEVDLTKMCFVFRSPRAGLESILWCVESWLHIDWILSGTNSIPGKNLCSYVCCWCQLSTTVFTWCLLLAWWRSFSVLLADSR